MQSLLGSLSYVPILKWKSGERQALATLEHPLRGRVAPLFLIPPSGDFDHEKGRPLTPLEHIKLFGRRLSDACGRLPAFVDAGEVDDDLHKRGLSDHPLTELLTRAQVSRAVACPATTLNRSDQYQAAVQRFAFRNPDLPLCLRLTPLDLEAPGLAERISTFLSNIRCEPDRIVLLLDFASMGALKPEEAEAFAEVLGHYLYALPLLFRWQKVVIALTSFPVTLKVRPGETRHFPRTDWLVYRTLIAREPDLIRVLAFGDYGIDSAPPKRLKGRPIPSAQLRYTTSDAYIVVKGQQAKKPVGYKAIYPVAEVLASHHHFMGAGFSAGDAFIGRVAARDPKTGTGNASTWRWSGTDHHLTRVLNEISVLLGHEIADPQAAPALVQAELFDM